MAERNVFITFVTIITVMEPSNCGMMEKQRIHMEYGLRSNSANIIWSLISTHGGLRQWIADYVEEDGDGFIFTWGDKDKEHETRKARIIDLEKPERIRLRWEDETDAEAYWEIRITRSDLTNDYIMEITDYAEADEADYMRDIWERNYEALHRNTGL